MDISVKKCAKCGTVGCTNFCSNCGGKMRDIYEDFVHREKRTKTLFKQSHYYVNNDYNQHVAEAVLNAARRAIMDYLQIPVPFFKEDFSRYADAKEKYLILLPKLASRMFDTLESALSGFALDEATVNNMLKEE